MNSDDSAWFFDQFFSTGKPLAKIMHVVYYTNVSMGESPFPAKDFLSRQWTL